MGKKKKKRDYFDIDADEQRRMLMEIDEMISTGSMTPDEQNLDDSDIDDFLTKLISERKSTLGVMKDTEETPVVETEKEKVKLDEDYLTEITVKRNKGIIDIVTISDGIRSCDIDLNALTEDDISIGNVENDRESLEILLIDGLREVMLNFYPSAIIMVDKFKDSIYTIDKYNDRIYNIFNYSDDNSDILLGYYISENTFDSLIELLLELHKKDRLLSFMTALIEITNNNGFSFSNLSDEYVKRLLLHRNVVKSTDNFIEMLINDDDTSCLENFTYAKHNLNILPSDYVSEVLAPYIYDEDEDEEEYTNPSFSDVLNTFKYVMDVNDEESMEEEMRNTVENLKDMEDDSDSPITSTAEPVKEYTVGTTLPSNDGTEDDETTSNVDVEDEDDPLDDLLDDHDEAEEIYFKGEKTPRTSMKPKKPKNNDDDFFVVKRQS